MTILRQHILLPFFCFLLVASFQSCEKDLPTQLNFESYAFDQLDEGGGNWKPILLSSPTQVAVPAPTDYTSDSYLAELAQLKEMSASLSAEQQEAVSYWGNNPQLRWNEIARELAAKYNLTPAPNPDGSYSAPDPANPSRYPLFPFAHPPYTCRMLAYWGAAQYDALIAAWYYKYAYLRPAPQQVDPTLKTHLPTTDLPSYPADGAVVAAVSEVILGAMFPLEKDYLAARAAEQRQALQWAGLHVASDVAAGEALGKAVAAVFLARAATDGMKNAQAPRAIADSLENAAQTRWGWHWENLESPQRPVGITPLFGRVKMWCVPQVEAVRPVPPPAPGSAAFEADAEELRRIARDLSPAQRKIANFWSDGLGSYTPPGHWNRLAAEFVVKYKLNPIRTARTFAYLNMAVMDAGISCWDAKYFYHYPRPSQAIAGFKTILGIPNFPSYTSGHSTFSAAAAEVLSHLFPAERSRCTAWAQEAAESRIYAGIHYRFDAEVGLTQGQQVAAFTLDVARADGAE